MEDTLSFKEDAFIYWYKCASYSELKHAIAFNKAEVIKARQRPFANVKESNFYNEQYIRWKVLEQIDKLRSDTITIVEFEALVDIDRTLTSE